ncbi:Fc.00g011870.m01.CDS01 [Cosmosporella sp. VM-42]
MGDATSVGMSSEDLLSQESLLLDPTFQQQTQQIQSPLQPLPPTTQPSPSTTSPLYTVFPSNPTHTSSPSSTTSSTKRKAPSSADDDDKAIKRQRNTLAARKYRQKRLDRIAELEKALEEMTGDRDDLKLKLVRKEAEVDALREMLGRK